MIIVLLLTTYNDFHETRLDHLPITKPFKTNASFLCYAIKNQNQNRATD